jgi:hypothetical protein
VLTVLVIALHVAMIAWVVHARVTTVTPAPEPVKVVLKVPIRKVAVLEPPGGGPKRPLPAHPHVRRRRIVMPKVIPPPVVEPPPPPVEDPPRMAEAEEAGDDGDAGGGGGGGTGTGIGTGTGPGAGAVKSKARKAWLTHTDWKCRRPGYDELGRIVVRIRVEVLTDGRPGQVTVVQPGQVTFARPGHGTVMEPGPEEFNRRAVDCARDETYLPALDPEGHAIVGSAEFGIEFLN